MPAASYRCQCRFCGETFFAEARGIDVCRRCSRRYGVKPVVPKPVPPRPPVPPAPPSPPTPPASAPAPEPEPPPAAPAAPAAPAPAREPAAALPPEAEEEIREAYRRMVLNNERPEGGRRRTLARRFGVTGPQLRQALGPLLDSGREGPTLSRQQQFEAERRFLRYLPEEAGAFRRAAERAAAESGTEPWEVARYLDQIHERLDRLAGVPEPSPEQREAILEAYREYLAGPGPAEGSLHGGIAERVGVTPRQVHRVLLEYRCSLRGGGEALPGSLVAGEEGSRLLGQELDEGALGT